MALQRMQKRKLERETVSLNLAC